MKIRVIGAGPCGCYLSYLLAKQGQKVSVYEEHKQIGKPVQCAGIVTSSIKELFDFPINEAVINKISRIEVSSQNKNIRFNLKNPDIILDREKFDKLLYKKAKQAGVKFHLGKKIKKIPQGIIIGADGPLSIVSKKLRNKQEVNFAIQARVRAKVKDKSKMQVFLKEKSFVWIVPESSSIARVGMIGQDIKQLNPYLIGKVIEYQSGILPKFNTDKKLHNKNIYLVGDAAGHIKETTYGGLVPGLRGAQALANSIINDKDYEKELKNVHQELKMHAKARKILDKMDEKDYDKLIGFSNNNKIIKLLETTDRDNFRKIVPKLFLYEPRLLFLMKFLFLF